MSDTQTPAGTPEYLEYGGGSPIPPEPLPGAGAPARRSRRSWWIGGGVVALLALGAGAWAAMGFFQQGSQPAEALPASTIAYVGIDLDPAGGQKIDAFRTLDKFPAFKDQVGIDSVDELRHKLGDSLVSGAGCDNLDYDHDIDPWLGNRAAFALVALPGSQPDSVVVVQVNDDDQARAGISALAKCGAASGVPDTGFVVHDGWAVLAGSQDTAEKVVDATDEGTLADDATYQKWTKAVGEAGVVNAYAAPDAGRYLASRLGQLFGSPLSYGLVGPDPMAIPGDVPSLSVESGAFRATAATDDPFSDALSGFQGGAATLRFTGDGLELAVAADGNAGQLSQLAGNTGGTLVQRLPVDTAAAAGLTFPKGWLDRQLDQMSDLFGGVGVSKQQAMRQLSRATGLDVPDDVETLLGSGVSVAIGKDFDLEAAENSADGTGLPIAVTVKGDPAAIEQVLDKVRAKTGDAPFLGSDSSGDLVVIGPSPAYRQHVLDGGSLGDDDTFQSVVPDAGAAGQLFYVSIDALEPSITQAAMGDQETIDNLTPLRAIGMSSWKESDGVARFSVKVSTN
ncbi:MAG TPA: DUF3352 domain-containing protein [Nocardioides sp.]|jgi:hypothetical protein|nr:DUF3352 domain-containing protein [Nocardioides sp.]